MKGEGRKEMLLCQWNTLSISLSLYLYLYLSISIYISLFIYFSFSLSVFPSFCALPLGHVLKRDPQEI